MDYSFWIDLLSFDARQVLHLFSTKSTMSDSNILIYRCIKYDLERNQIDSAT